MEKTRSPQLLQAIKAAGGISNIARAVNLTRQAVSAWDDIPVKYIKEVAELTGISRKKLRPDIYA